MADHLEQRHVLVLSIAERSGSGSIGTYRALPESIAAVTALEVRGARVAIALPGRDPLILEVTQSPETITKAMAHARNLDGAPQEAGTSRQ